MNYAGVSKVVEAQGLMVFGGFHSGENDGVPARTRTLLLLGPAPDYWSKFISSPEWLDKVPDPVDRWSGRIVTGLADKLDATPVLPFGGPPYAPFLSWALKTGRCWTSPVGMLVHDTTGLFVSFRGALAFRARLELPVTPNARPCETCRGQPCRTACPVNALGPDGYQVDACHAYLDTDAGQDCLSRGCAARRACPVSAGSARTDAQSAHHMRYFHK